MNYTMVTLSVHEPGGETVCWKKGKEEEKLRALNMPKPTSQLTAWFKLNCDDEGARKYTFLEVPRHYSWEQRNKKWKKRKLNRKTLARIHPVSPRYAELFAIRLLALNVRGPRSFEELRTVGDIEYDTFMEAAKVMDASHLP